MLTDPSSGYFTSQHVLNGKGVGVEFGYISGNVLSVSLLVLKEIIFGFPECFYGPLNQFRPLFARAKC